MKMLGFLKVVLFVFLCGVTGIVSVSYAQSTPVQKQKKSVGTLPSYLQYKSYGNVNKDYSIAHRTQDEVLDWVNRRVSNLLTFTAQDVNKHFDDSKQFFIEIGWDEFSKYVKEVKLKDEVVQRNYSLNSIVDGHIFIKRQGSVGGIYRWLVDVPVLMSFYQQDATGKIIEDLSASAQVNVVVTVTRVAEGDGNDQMAVAGWQVTNRLINDQKKKKKNKRNRRSRK